MRAKLFFTQSWSRWTGVALIGPMVPRSSFGTEMFQHLFDGAPDIDGERCPTVLRQRAHYLL